LEDALKRKIVGQEEAIQLVAAAVRRERAGIASTERPSGSFMFLGPSGVGKPLMANLLARESFDDETALTRIDMSEMMWRPNVARLLGAPAGYVGYEEGGRLTETIRRKPYSVVLFDEIEKAHPDVLNILLQILEEGELTDAMGKKANFRNTIVILTSNLGSSVLNKWARGYGFADSEKQTDGEIVKNEVIRQVQKHFRPEFLNRIDKIIVFDPLKKTDIEKIVALEIVKLKRKLSEQKISLTIPDSVVRHLAEKSFDPAQGARLVRKNIQDLLEDRIAEHILGSSRAAKKTIRLTLTKSGPRVQNRP
jgi:ATP-dependent Clp protease ATP-binding subunit ClpA